METFTTASRQVKKQRARACKNALQQPMNEPLCTVQKANSSLQSSGDEPRQISSHSSSVKSGLETAEGDCSPCDSWSRAMVMTGLRVAPFSSILLLRGTGNTLGGRTCLARGTLLAKLTLDCMQRARVAAAGGAARSRGGGTLRRLPLRL